MESFGIMKRRRKTEKNTWRKLTGSRRSLRLFSVVMVVAVALITFSTLIQYRNLEDRRQTQQAWYGSWQAVVLDTDERGMREARDNLVISSVGKVKTAWLDNSLLAGTGDTSFFDLANLSWKKGRLPETESEMAAEAIWLDQQGLSYDLGQTIRIGEKAYTLTGILDSFSAGWTAGDHIPQVWLTQIEKPAEINLYLRARSGYEDVFDEWKPSTGVLVKNMNLELEYDPLAPSNLPWTVVSAAAGMGALFLIHIILSRWMESREITMIRLKSMGADTHILMKATGKQLILGSLWGLPVIAAGVFLVKCPWPLTGGLLGFWFLLLMAALLWTRLMIQRLPASFSSHADKMHVPGHLPKGRAKLTVHMLAERWLRWNWKAAIAGPVLLAVLIVCAAFCTARAWFDRSMEMQIERQPDFRLYPRTAGSTITDEDLEKLKQLPGVKTIYSYTLQDNLIPSDTMWTISWQGMENSELFTIPEDFRQDVHFFNAGEKGFYCSILSPEQLPALTQVLDGKPLEADEAAVYLPEYIWSVEEYNGTSVIRLFPNNTEITFPDSMVIRKESSLKAGDTLQIAAPDGTTRRMTVRTIIDEPLNYVADHGNLISQWTIPFVWPYVVIVPEGFFGPDAVNNVEIWTDGRRDEALQSSVASLANHAGLALQNDASRKDRYIDFFSNEELLYLILTLLFAVAWILVFAWFRLNVRRGIQQFLRQFEILGTDEKVCAAIRKQITGRLALLSILAVFLMTCAGIWIQFSFVPNLSVIVQAVPGLVNLEGVPVGVYAMLRTMIPWIYGGTVLLGLLPVITVNTGLSSSNR